jgi:formamidopyrimidine-DNA glycosylase
MPELPEVQTIVNDLQILTGDTITGFWTDFQKAIKSERFEKDIVGKKIKSIERLSKNVVIKMANNKFIVIHLKMTGKLLLMESGAWSFEHDMNKHVHHIFSLKKHGSLIFSDIRKFATLEVLDAEALTEITKNKGTDPFSKDFTLQNFTNIIAGKKNKSVKSTLMNQSVISGIGNIYASEIPFDAKINPLRKGEELKKNEIKSLFESILKILKKAVAMRGTSISDYRDAKNKKGRFQNELKVYGKAGEKCMKCDTIIEKVIIEQRSTFYCPRCQK